MMTVNEYDEALDITIAELPRGQSTRHCHVCKRVKDIPRYGSDRIVLNLQRAQLGDSGKRITVQCCNAICSHVAVVV